MSIAGRTMGTRIDDDEREVGGYTLHEVVAPSGGQGRVYRGVDPAGTVVSVKRLAPGALGAHRIEDVHGALSRRRHPALGRQLAVFHGPDDGALHVVAAWVEGETLAVRARGAAVADLLSWVRQVAEGLDLLHADLDPDGPLLHRDVKPSNIVVTPTGGAVLIDPGLARAGPSLATGSPYGTPGFVPPECMAEPTAGSAAADRWQLAATLVAALLDGPPGWTGDNEALRAALVARCAGEVDRPGALADAVLTMLAAEPGDRPASAAAWVASLHLAAGGRATRSSRRRLPVAALASALAVAVVAIGVALVVGAGGAQLGAGSAAGGDGDDAPVRSGPGATLPAVIDTRRTSGSHIADQRNAYLSTDVVDRCRALGCEVAGSALASGTEVTLTCRAYGERVTNGNDRSALDDDNPLLFSSDRWYGVRLDDGTAGFLSEVWIHPESRDGTGLPLC
jgi:hypothetical protein